MFSDQCVINVFDFVLQTFEGWQARRTVFTDRFPHGMPLAHVGRKRVTGKRAELLSKLQSISRPVCRLA